MTKITTSMFSWPTENTATPEDVLDYVTMAIERIYNAYDSLDDPQFELGYLDALESLLVFIDPTPPHVVEYCRRYAEYIVHKLYPEVSKDCHYIITKGGHEAQANSQNQERNTGQSTIDPERHLRRPRRSRYQISHSSLQKIHPRLFDGLTGIVGNAAPSSGACHRTLPAVCRYCFSECQRIVPT